MDKGGAGAIVEEGAEAKKSLLQKQTIEMPDHIRRGFFYIQQRGRVLGLTKKFKRYWFCVDEECCQIRYYTPSMNLKGTVDLRLASDVQIQPHEDKFYPFVINSERTGRSTVLASLTQEECTKTANFIRQIIQQMPPINESLYKQFVDADADGSFTLEFPEVKALFAQRNVQITISTMRQKFDEVDLDGDESLDFSEFERLDELFRQDTYATELFRKYCTCSRFMDRQTFKRFLRRHQHEHHVKKEELLKIISAHKPGESGAPQNVMDVWGFTDWLTSTKENGAVSTRHLTELTDDMKKPLNTFFVFSSRQTYLLTSDPMGPVGVAGYTNALRRGARFVELDIKADLNGSPVVGHPQGQNKVPLKDVLSEISRYAFSEELGHAGTMPLIVSLNVYLAGDEQAIAASMIEEAFGPRLATIPRKGALPSVESLMGKIILMMKLTTPEELARSSSTMSSIDDRSSVLPFLSKKKKKGKKGAGPVSPTSPSKSPFAPPASGSGLRVCVTRVASDSESEEEGTIQRNEGETKLADTLHLPLPLPSQPGDDPANFVNPQLLGGFGAQAADQVSMPLAQEEVSGESSEEEHLVVRRTRVEFVTRSLTIDRLEKLIHLRTRRFNGVRRPSGLPPFVKDQDSYLPSTPTSLSTTRLAMMCSKEVEGAVRQFAAKHIVKVYPNSDRPTDPPGWIVGAQIVPVNLNSTSSMTLAEEAFFLDNGCSGFVEKPRWMLVEPYLPPPEHAIKLTVKIVSARQLPRIDSEVVDPFVAMFVKGWIEDQNRFTTKVIVNNGWDPRWDETHEFILEAPELDVLLFSIWDKDNNSQNDFIANAAVAVRSLKLGVHSLPLYNENRVLLLGSRLLIEVNIEPAVTIPVPKELASARGDNRRRSSYDLNDDDSDISSPRAMMSPRSPRVQKRF